MKTVIGIKKGMTQVFKDEKSLPVTVVDITDCKVAFKDKTGYELGIGKKSHANKALDGKYKALGYVPLHREYFTGEADKEVGEVVTPDTFTSGSSVAISATTKGKGFAGVVKRWGFAGGPKTHGQSDRHRAPGSIGAGTTPGRILKGKRMAGRLGGDLVTLHNREVVDVVDTYILVKGPVPGNNGDKVIIKLEK